MLDNPTQMPILDWLDLRPELLSATQRIAPAPGKPAAAVEVPAPAETPATIAISAQSVLPWSGGMVFYQPSPFAPPPALGATTHAYRSPQTGGTQEQALAEMAGYLTTGLDPR